MMEPVKEEKNGQMDVAEEIKARERECKSTEMREQTPKKETGLLFVISRKNLILQLFVPGSSTKHKKEEKKKHITRFRLKRSRFSVFFHFSRLLHCNHYQMECYDDDEKRHTRKILRKNLKKIPFCCTFCSGEFFGRKCARGC